MESQEPNQLDPNLPQPSQPLADQGAGPSPPISGPAPALSSVSGVPSGLPDDNNSPTSISQASSTVQVPDDASDADLIEKEWVVKAKDIVNHTQNNPFEQQKALSKFKADYMKKRYNKDIKIEDA